MALDTVAQMIASARTLLTDTVEPYRYTDAAMIDALNQACMEAKRLRPDIFLRSFSVTLPTYTATTDVIGDEIPDIFKPAFVYYLCGKSNLSDEEETQDQRATIFLNKFVAQLVTLPS